MRTQRFCNAFTVANRFCTVFNRITLLQSYAVEHWNFPVGNMFEAMRQRHTSELELQQ